MILQGLLNNFVFWEGPKCILSHFQSLANTHCKNSSLKYATDIVSPLKLETVTQDGEVIRPKSPRIQMAGQRPNPSLGGQLQCFSQQTPAASHLYPWFIFFCQTSNIPRIYNDGSYIRNGKMFTEILFSRH